MVEFIVWTFVPGPGACADCQSMARFHVDEPSQPHPFCKCTITWHLDYCTLEWTDITIIPVGIHEEIVGYITPGGNRTVSSSSTGTSGGSIGGSGGGSYGGGKAGISLELSRSTAETRTESQTYVHMPSICEGTQVIVKIVETQVVHNLKYWECRRLGLQMTLEVTTRQEIIGWDQRCAQ